MFTTLYINIETLQFSSSEIPFLLIEAFGGMKCSYLALSFKLHGLPLPSSVLHSLGLWLHQTPEPSRFYRSLPRLLTGLPHWAQFEQLGCSQEVLNYRFPMIIMNNFKLIFVNHNNKNSLIFISAIIIYLIHNGWFPIITSIAYLFTCRKHTSYFLENFLRRGGQQLFFARGCPKIYGVKHHLRRQRGVFCSSIECGERIFTYFWPS